MGGMLVLVGRGVVCGVAALYRRLRDNSWVSWRRICLRQRLDKEAMLMPHRKVHPHPARIGRTLLRRMGDDFTSFELARVLSLLLNHCIILLETIESNDAMRHCH